MDIAFYVLSSISIVSALAIILVRNQIYAVLLLIVCFLSIAGHFFLMNASFLGIVQLIVYAGAVMVLFLFVIMLINFNQESTPKKRWGSLIMGVALSVILLGLMMIPLLKVTQDSPNTRLLESQGSAMTLGKILFQDFMIPFEVSALIFLSATMGVVLISQKREKK